MIAERGKGNTNQQWKMCATFGYLEDLGLLMSLKLEYLNLWCLNRVYYGDISKMAKPTNGQVEWTIGGVCHRKMQLNLEYLAKF